MHFRFKAASRLMALLLVPCLVTDPVSAAALGSLSSPLRLTNPSSFSDQALTLPVRYGHQVLVKTMHLFSGTRLVDETNAPAHHEWANSLSGPFIAQLFVSIFTPRDQQISPQSHVLWAVADSGGAVIALVGLGILAQRIERFVELRVTKPGVRIISLLARLFLIIGISLAVGGPAVYLLWQSLLHLSAIGMHPLLRLLQIAFTLGALSAALPLGLSPIKLPKAVNALFSEKNNRYDMALVILAMLTLEWVLLFSYYYQPPVHHYLSNYLAVIFPVVRKFLAPSTQLPDGADEIRPFAEPRPQAVSSAKDFALIDEVLFHVFHISTEHLTPDDWIIALVNVLRKHRHNSPSTLRRYNGIHHRLLDQAYTAYMSDPRTAWNKERLTKDQIRIIPHSLGADRDLAWFSVVFVESDTVFFHEEFLDWLTRLPAAQGRGAKILAEAFGHEDVVRQRRGVWRGTHRYAQELFPLSKSVETALLGDLRLENLDRQTPEPSTLNLNELLALAVLKAKPLAAEKNITLNLDLTSTDLYISKTLRASGPETLIEDSLLNALTNRIRIAPSGSTVLAILRQEGSDAYLGLRGPSDNGQQIVSRLLLQLDDVVPPHDGLENPLAEQPIYNGQPAAIATLQEKLSHFPAPWNVNQGPEKARASIVDSADLLVLRSVAQFTLPLSNSELRMDWNGTTATTFVVGDDESPFRMPLSSLDIEWRPGISMLELSIPPAAIKTFRSKGIPTSGKTDGLRWQFVESAPSLSLVLSQPRPNLFSPTEAASYTGGFWKQEDKTMARALKNALVASYRHAEEIGIDLLHAQIVVHPGKVSVWWSKRLERSTLTEVLVTLLNKAWDGLAHQPRQIIGIETRIEKDFDTLKILFSGTGGHEREFSHLWERDYEAVHTMVRKTGGSLSVDHTDERVSIRLRWPTVRRSA